MDQAHCRSDATLKRALLKKACCVNDSRLAVIGQLMEMKAINHRIDLFELQIGPRFTTCIHSQRGQMMMMRTRRSMRAARIFGAGVVSLASLHMALAAER